jgi:hypothetical protein
VGGVGDQQIRDRVGYIQAAAMFAVIWLLAGCGHGSVSIHGSVQSHGTCLSLVYLSGGSVVDHLQMTFRDSSGKVIGTARTGVGVFDTPKPWGQYTICTAKAPYSLHLPKEDFYQVQVEGLSQQPAPISYTRLANNGFEYDVEISSD